jgi:CheY-like chemotaxis protein
LSSVHTLSCSQFPTVRLVSDLRRLRCEVVICFQASARESHINISADTKHGAGPEKKPVVRVVIAEDNDDLRAVMPPLIEETSDLCCVATTASLGEVGPLIERHQAHVAVLDIELHGGSVLKHLAAMCKQFPATRFVIHSGHSNSEVIRRVHEAGASAYVLKSGDFDDLIAAIRGVATV